MVLGFLAVSLLVGVIGYICVNTSQKALQKAIGESSVSLAVEVLSAIDRGIYNRIEEFQAYTEDLESQKIVIESNEEFEGLGDIQDYINKKDAEWTSAPLEEISPFMEELMGNELTRELREKFKFYKEKYGYKVFGEIFATNKYGANIAQTGKTTDYRQDDEEWWQMAKKDGLYVADVEYDRSADVYSTDIGIRIDDENNFIGAMKVILNIEEVINIIREAKATVKYKTAQFKLTTKDGKLIYSTEDFRFFENISDTLLLHFKQEGEHISYFIAGGDNPGKGEKLFAHANSKGYRDFKGLGWALVIEYETEEIFAPVVELRNNILVISLAVTVLAITMGLSISRVISRPISKLSAATVKISGGDLDTQIEVESKDEIGELAQSFNEMAGKLNESYTHLEEKVLERTINLEEKVLERTIKLRSANAKLEEEIAERRRMGEKLGANRMELYKRTKFLSSVLESLTHPFYVIDASDYTIQMANSAAYPWTLPEKITCYMLSCGRDKPCEGKDHPCPLEEIKKTGEAVTVEHVHCDEDGHRRYIEVHAYPIHDAAGDISQIIEYCIDITDRKRTEEALRASEANYREIFESANDGIFVHDLESGKILSVNQKACEMFGYAREELVKLTVGDISTDVSPYDQKHVIRWIKKTAKEGPQLIEWIGKGKSGRTFWVEVNLKLAVIEGEERVLAIIRDISERKKAAEFLKELNKGLKADAAEIEATVLPSS